MSVPENMPTVPNPALRDEPTHRAGRVPAPRPSPSQRAPIPAPPPARRVLPAYRRPVRASRSQRWVWLLPLGAMVAIGLTIAGISLLVGTAYARGILPGVMVGDVRLGGYAPAQAGPVLARAWDTLVLRDEERAWSISPASLGILLDVNATINRAYAVGREAGDALPALLGRVAVAPVIRVDGTLAREELARIAERIVIAPINAGVAYVEGQVQATTPHPGRALDIEASLLRLLADGGQALVNGDLELVMRAVQPEVTDATPLVNAAQMILSSNLDVRVFDPVTGDAVYWSVPPQTWGTWLTVTTDPTAQLGLSFSADSAAVHDFLQQQASATLDASRTIDIEAGVRAITASVRGGRTDGAVLTVVHRPRTHTVRAGETITSIAWDYGIPYPYIQQANGGITSLSTGQQIIIPPADSFLLQPVVPDKRIVVSISQQRTRVYENGQMIHNWASSTGISDSPTWPGIYQVISHERNAYAGNWNLWMPYFIGVYRPVPGADFTNGFHGFPTRGGGQILWENSLGRRVTYGCILLSNANAEWLYAWAETGVVVEIQP